MDNSRSERPLAFAALLALCALGLLLRLGTTQFLPNIYWPDEYYQTLEQAHRLAFGPGIIPWEYREGSRSWILPGALAVLMRAGNWIVPHPSGYLWACWLVLTLLSLTPIIVGFRWGYHCGGWVAALVTGFLGAIWFELVYFGPKALFEPVAGHILLLGLVLVYPDNNGASRRRMFAAGLLLGLSVALRVHLAPVLAVTLLFVCRAAWREKWVPAAGGAILILVAAGTLDALTWTYPFQSFWLIFSRNILDGVAHLFGTSPWYAYAGKMILQWSGALALMVLLIWMGARRLPLLFWLIVTIIALHSFVPHKEYRFIYPAIPLAVALAGVGSVELTRRAFPAWWNGGRGVVLLFAAWSLTSGSLAVSDHFRGKWVRDRGTILAFRELSRQQDACGLGLHGPPWFSTPGYTVLHRDIPLYDVHKPEEFAKLRDSFNYVLTSESPPLDDPEFQPWNGWREAGMVIYRRPGGCSAAGLTHRTIKPEL